MYLNILSEHYIEAIMVATVGMVGVILARVLAGKSLRKIRVAQYFCGFVLIGYLYLVGIATGVLNIHDFSLEIIRQRSMNFVPFARLTNEQGVMNLLLFLPLGLLAPLVFDLMKKYSWAKILLASFVVSLMIEVLQLFHVWRSFDINDLIFNVLGGLIGYGIYRVLRAIFRR